MQPLPAARRVQLWRACVGTCTLPSTCSQTHASPPLPDFAPPHLPLPPWPTTPTAGSPKIRAKLGVALGASDAEALGAIRAAKDSFR